MVGMGITYSHVTTGCQHTSTTSYLLPHVHAQGIQQSVLSVRQHKICQIWRSRRHSKIQVSLKSWEGGKTYFL